MVEFRPSNVKSASAAIRGLMEPDWVAEQGRDGWPQM
jgi:hypothetical protein